jgi:hypothetical protein
MTIHLHAAAGNVAACERDLASGTEEYIKNEVCKKQLINDLRSDPGCAGWAAEQFREYAQRVWDAHPQEGGAAEVAEHGSSQAADPHPGALLRGDILPVSGGTTKRQHESRHRRDKHHSPQERRREFLAQLAVG